MNSVCGRSGGEAVDGAEPTFELKFDGFRALADTVNGRMLSKRSNRMHRFETLPGSLPVDCVLDGEVNEVNRG